MMFLDTSGLFNLMHLAESQHELAKELFDIADTRLTTSYVLAELAALGQSRRVLRLQMLEYLNLVQNSSEIFTIYVDERLHRQGVRLLGTRADKEWSLCDAVSFEVMRQYGIQEALTSDHHFEQAGFVRLLRS